MDKKTGKPFVVDDEEITSEVTFTPETSNKSLQEHCSSVGHSPS